ncbi:beta-ketoacyl-[acyl-carrier-protein] synthase family protein [Pseudobacteriovorax antillogorgiicola]|uniref:3-oxoacyl-(Acyl-carrier-protein) synthase n=1 Tax=Pseudobacteriovorax antillogorgiicola TaxID=1513793 RepID=A0A1Y6B3N1_9BACT|nr:beta-ketoacyl synthase N-terminal-like domain-containing protein [Pseudobacteriovorax antillogorgiicola]TCS59523.1 3-oxoacyl-(acyl-carrier-protein) synthase [Pseudobacteriovorax antillogorgiicola]SME87853.1 3-oxoacyl-(acyl-carrier-protein) synthase [Pseudobacteriovorax antillogorgiicola]
MDVFIRGRGLISPGGLNLSNHMHALLEGQDLLRESLRDGLGLLPTLAEERLLQMRRDHRQVRHMDTTAVLALLCCQEAAEEAAGLDASSAVVLGSSRGPTESWESAIDEFRQGHQVPAYTSPITTPNSIPSCIAKWFGLDGLHFYTSAACSTSLHAIGLAYALIKSGQVPEAVCGGVEYATTPFTKEILSRARVLAKSTECPYPHRPMSEDRSGMVLSSGAACLVLTASPQRAIAKISGYGAATDHASLAGVSENATGLQKAMTRALVSANLSIEDIDFIAGHGASTKKGDAAEMNAIRHVFGNRPPAITFHKWLTGHMLGASAGSSVVLASEHLHHGELPRLPYLKSSLPLQADFRHALVLSLGFGGNAGALVISRLEP